MGCVCERGRARDVHGGDADAGRLRIIKPQQDLPHKIRIAPRNLDDVLFVVSATEREEFLSPAVTLDCHASLKLNVGDALYTNRYRPMFRIISDDVGAYDLLFPCCRPEMYDFFYRNGDGHPN